MRHLQRRILHHKHNMRDHRRRDVLGLYKARSYETTGPATPGMETGQWRAELRWRGFCVFVYSLYRLQ